MKLVEIDIGPSPAYPGRTRLSGIVRYDEARGGPVEEVVWYEVPAAFGGDFSDSGNGWLAFLLPIAVASNEPLVLSRPVDARFLDGAADLMRAWREVYPDIRPVPIEAPVEAAGTHATGPRTAAYFSGGVDSFDTALRERAAPIDDLILALGSFDTVEGNDATFARIEARMQRAADALSKTLVPVTTNQMRTSRATNKVALRASHSFLAGVGLALESRYSRLLFSSWTGHRWRGIDGDYTLFTQLLSTSRTSVENEGASLTRVDKIAAIARSEAAHASLRVCYQSGHENNCMRCAKCMRTAVALEAIDGLERWPTFGGAALTAERVRRTTIAAAIERFYWEELPPFCRAHGREDLARAAERVLARARRLDPLRPLVRWLRRRPAIAALTHRAEALVQDVDPLSLRPRDDSR